MDKAFNFEISVPGTRFYMTTALARKGFTDKQIQDVLLLHEEAVMEAALSSVKAIIREPDPPRSGRRRAARHRAK